MEKALKSKHFKKWAKQFAQDPAQALALNAVINVGIDAAAQRPDVVKEHTFVFDYVCKQGEPTAQKKSGRCWYFAALNSLRGPLFEKLGVKSFEFSQTHLYFYDKLEKANVFLEECIDQIDSDYLDRKFNLLLNATVYDGGFWDYFQYLCMKYGLVPKSVAPETFHSQDSYMYVKQMDLRLKRALANMRTAYQKGATRADLRKMKEEVLGEIYNLSVKALGKPVESFVYAYQDQDEKTVVLPEMTPVEFFERYIGVQEFERRVVLLSDPRPEIPVGRVIEVEGVRNVIEQPLARGLNVPIETLVSVAKVSIMDGVPLWFACDVGKDIDRAKGILDTRLYDYDQLLTPVGEFSKADRFRLGYSSATHAMNLTGVRLDEQKNPLYWKVENSWGEDQGRKGTYSMSQSWFEEYVYEIIVDRKYVPEEYLKGLDLPPVTLPSWDYLADILLGRFVESQTR